MLLAISFVNNLIYIQFLRENCFNINFPQCVIQTQVFGIASPVHAYPLQEQRTIYLTKTIKKLKTTYSSAAVSRSSKGMPHEKVSGYRGVSGSSHSLLTHTPPMLSLISVPPQREPAYENLPGNLTKSTGS